MPTEPSKLICLSIAQNTENSVICGRRLDSPGLIIIVTMDCLKTEGGRRTRGGVSVRPDVFEGDLNSPPTSPFFPLQL
jgi:hypothetical protein